MAKLDIFMGSVSRYRFVIVCMHMVPVNNGRGSVSTDLHVLTSDQEESLAD